jgi:hypothetical protein
MRLHPFRDESERAFVRFFTLCYVLYAVIYAWGFIIGMQKTDEAWEARMREPIPAQVVAVTYHHGSNRDE